MMKRYFLGAAAALTIAASPANAATNLVQNGGFELGTDPGSYSQVNVGQTNISFWNVISGNVDYIGTYWQGQGGSGRSVDLAGTALGTISQTISGLTIGQAYEFSFYTSKNPDGGAAVRTGTAMLGSVTIPFSYAALNDTTNMQWMLNTFTFVATATSFVLSFSADASAGCCYGPAIDTVSIAAVPEPEIWAMLLFGLGAVGWQMRRRNRLQVVTA